MEFRPLLNWREKPPPYQCRGRCLLTIRRPSVFRRCCGASGRATTPWWQQHAHSAAGTRAPDFRSLPPGFEAREVGSTIQRFPLASTLTWPEMTNRTGQGRTSPASQLPPIAGRRTPDAERESSRGATRGDWPNCGELVARRTTFLAGDVRPNGSCEVKHRLRRKSIHICEQISA